MSNAYEELKSFYNSSDEYGSVYKFSQVFKDYEVIGRRIVVSTDEKNIANYLDSNIVPTSLLNNMNFAVSFSKKDAENKIKETYGNVKKDKTELIIYTYHKYENAPILAYRVKNDSYTFYINAHSGDVIDFNSHIIY